MNCEQANQIPIREVLESFSLFPSKENHKAAFYFAIDREEKTPSFHVDFVKNKAFDFGTGKKYDNVNIVQAIKKCSVSEALEYLSGFDFTFQQQNNFCSGKKKEPLILDVKEISNPSLLNYLKIRNVSDQKHLLDEIHYEIFGKRYFGIGFKNDSDGWEIRNSIGKFCLGKKDITTIRNDKDVLRIFEGFFDYLSFEKIKESFQKMPSDYLILNSVSLVHRTEEIIKDYSEIGLYLDNDKAGDLATERFNKIHNNIIDCRDMYSNFKDLNEFIIQLQKIEEEIQPKRGIRR